MKNVWKMVAFVMMAVMSVSLTACGDDDDDNTSGGGSGGGSELSEAALIGTWEIDYRQSWEVIDGQKIEYKTLPENYLQEMMEEKQRIEFKDDHTVNVFQFDEGKWSLNYEDSGTWGLEGKSLKIKTNKGREPQDLEIYEIDNNHFVLKHKGVEKEQNGEVVIETYSFCVRV